jgi:hypothetical protein
VRCEVVVTEGVGFEGYARAGYCTVVGAADKGDEEVCRGLCTRSAG